jgi:hypothetical protein
MADPEEDQPPGPPPNKRKKPGLTSGKLKEIATFLLMRKKEGSETVELQHGAVAEVAKEFAVNRHTVARHRKHIKEEFVTKGTMAVSPRKRGKSGRKQHARWNITLTCQPINSPDCNVGDLAFFWQFKPSTGR